MKRSALEELAIRSYEENRKQKPKYHIDDKNYIDWFVRGAETILKQNPSKTSIVNIDKLIENITVVTDNEDFESKIKKVLIDVVKGTNLENL